MHSPVYYLMGRDIYHQPELVNDYVQSSQCLWLHMIARTMFEEEIAEGLCLSGYT